MPTVTARVQSPLTPEAALRVLTDFGSSRAAAWAGVDDEHLRVHDSGVDWADVTEGNNIGWERERYSWDAAAGTVSAVTTDSNLWASGSRWDYRITPLGDTPGEGGSRVEVTVLRNGKGIKGKLVGALLMLIGKKMITRSLAGALKAT